MPWFPAAFCCEVKGCHVAFVIVLNLLRRRTSYTECHQAIDALQLNGVLTVWRYHRLRARLSSDADVIAMSRVHNPLIVPSLKLRGQRNVCGRVINTVIHTD